MRRPRRDTLLLGGAGAALVLTQYVAVREIGSTFFSTELVILGATIVTLAGPSLAYALAHRLSPGALAVWGAFSVAAHLALPVGLRPLVGLMSERGLEGWALAATVVGGGLLLCGFYAVFLPRLASEPASLPRLYATELAGSLAGLALLLVLPSWRSVLAAYWLIAAAVLWLGVSSAAPAWRARRWGLAGGAAVAAAALAVAYPSLDRAAAAAYYRGYHGLRAPRVVETVYSAYQRIDVVDVGNADGLERMLFLDGVPFYRSGDLDLFNVFMARVPGKLRGAPGRALVVGSGSFSSAAQAKRLGYDVTVVEIDGAVAEVGFRRFAGVHGLARGDVHLVVDDGRRFLAASRPGTFDLIVLDVPAPFHVQTAMLHTPRFYRLVASRLAPGGVAAVSLCDGVDGEVGRSIAASALAAFGEVAVVESEGVGLGILYGGARLPFDAEAIAAELRAADREGGLVFADGETRRRVAGARPLDERNLAAVLALARSELEGAFDD